MSDQVDLWGNVVTPFTTAKERYGIWPTTVWPCDLSDPKTQELKRFIGDAGEARPEVFTRATDDKSVYRGKVTTSIFNPAVAAWLLNCYAPAEGVVFDPFAGGGTRALVSAAWGLDYVGVELRAEEVDAINTRAVSHGLAERITIHQGDAATLPEDIPTKSADVLITCPPYWNLETYDGGPEDMSMASTYEAFLGRMLLAITETHRVLKPGAFSCWVVGLIRDAAGGLLAMNHDIARLHAVAGFRFKEEIILHQLNNGAMQRVGQFDKGDRRLVRLHEYALIFERK